MTKSSRVGLYTIDKPAVYAGDQTVSSLYDWWFYAEMPCPLFSNAYPVKGAFKASPVDRELPTDYMDRAVKEPSGGTAQRHRWIEALHAYVAMHEWRQLFWLQCEGAKTPSLTAHVHRPLHELVHRIHDVESGISDLHLLSLVRREQDALTGFTRANPFRKASYG